MQALASPVSPRLAEAIGWVLIHSIWQIALVALVVGVVLRILHAGTPNARYSVAILGLVVATGWPIYCFVDSVSNTGPAMTSMRPVKIVRSDIGPAFVITDATASAFSASAASDGPVAQLQRSLAPALPWLFVLWAVGVLMRGGLLVAGAVSVFRVHRDASPLRGEWLRVVARLRQKLGVWQPVFLVESMRAEVPFVVGWLRPTIVLPASALTGMSTTQLENIIAHELAHVRRHDYLVNLAQVGLETLFFYHPGVWWLSERIRIEREHCCDDLAAATCAGPVSYARALAQLEVLRAAPMPAISATGGSLLDRIRRLTSRSVVRSERGVSGVTAMLLALAVALPIAAIVSVSNGQDTPDSPKATVVEVEMPEVALTADQALRLGRLGLDADDINAFRKVGLTKFEVLRRFAMHGIDSDDFVQFRKAGHDKPEVVLDLARHGVDPGDIADFVRVGLSGLDAKQLLSLARHGVDADDAAQLQVFMQSGDDTKKRVRKLVRLARFGIDGDDISEFKSLKLPGFGIEDVVKLKRYGVDADDVRAFHRIGEKVTDVSKIVRLARHGVDADDLQALRSAGYAQLTTDDAIQLSRHGIDGGDLRALKRAGLSGLTIDQVVELARHGVDGGDFQAYRDAGLPELTVEDALQLARYGVDAGDVARARAEGLASTVRELIRLARRGWR